MSTLDLNLSLNPGRNVLRVAPPHISVTSDRQHLIEAARALSLALAELGWNHAFIGGFAWALLGSDRPTQMSIFRLSRHHICLFVAIHDIDIIIEPKKGLNLNLLEVRSQLEELDERFARAGVKLYFVREPEYQHQEGQDREQLVKKSKRNVLIETLSAGKIGLPALAQPIYNDPENSIAILHPTILSLTKFKRWSGAYRSQTTHLATRKKRRVDETDIMYMIKWLCDEKMKISFADYAGKTREELLRFVATFHAAFRQDGGFCSNLKDAMYEEDWNEMLETSPLEMETNMLPPEE